MSGTFVTGGAHRLGCIVLTTQACGNGKIAGKASNGGSSQTGFKIVKSYERADPALVE
jgi:hypothetical protein